MTPAIAAKYPVGIAARYTYENKRGRIKERWPGNNEWWYRIEYPDGAVRGLPESELVGMED